MVKKVHFIGIGGIGVSAVARMMLFEGKEVSGSDLAASPVTQALQSLGAKIYFGHKAEHLTPDLDLVVYTIAAAADNPELVRARELKIPSQSYPEFLGQLSRQKKTIAVAGTHGKTTTTAMLARALIAAGFDPTVIVGSWLSRAEGNFIAGQADWLLVEACEYQRSFLNLWPKVLIITNIDNDHLDYYRDLADIQSAFAEFATRVPQDGFLICQAENSLLAPVIKNAVCQIVDYEKITIAGLKLQVPGWHNLADGKAALAVALTFGASRPGALAALNKFTGVWRRFEYLGQTSAGARVYDDYGHHPTAIKATLAGARELFPRARLTVVFQPHLYSRTKLLLKEFAGSFALADEVLVLPIYAAREKPDPTITSQTLATAISHSKYFPDFLTAQKYLRQRLRAGDVFITLGAGDVYHLAESLVVR